MSRAAGSHALNRARLHLAGASLLVGIASVSVAVLPASMASAIPANTVMNCNGTGSGSLPAVVANASSGATINFAVPCPSTSPIILGGTIQITDTLTFQGLGPTNTVISGGNAVEPFFIYGGSASFSQITIENGLNDVGGGIWNDGGNLTVTDSTLSGNAATMDGGAIENAGGTVEITDSTLSGNSVTASGADCGDCFGGSGGAVVSDDSLTITDSTLTDNTVDVTDCPGCAAAGGAIWSNNSATVADSTLAGNTAVCVLCDAEGDNILITGGASISVGASVVSDPAGSAGNCATESGSVTDAGYNLEDDAADSCGFSATDHDIVGESPGLGSLRNNGGPTLTMAPSTTSPVLDKIPVSTTLNSVNVCGSGSTDQRGVARPEPSVGPQCDMGAVELALPVAQAGSYATPFDTTLVVNAPGMLTGVTDANPSPTTPYTATVVTGPSNGTLTPDPNGDGGFRYTPNTGFYGTDSFTFIATDAYGFLSGVQQVSIVVGSCPGGDTAYGFFAIYATGTFNGLFCVNAAGTGTYTQSGGATGTGEILKSGGTISISASGKNLALLGQKTATSSTFTETAPAPIKTGTFNLTTL